MHPRNPYNNPPDFSSLADSYPPLKPFVVLDAGGRPAVDFTNVEGQRRLTEAILARDFRLQVVVPPTRLCPPVPNRLNYILWIQDIMSAFPSDSPRTIRGIDIGTGVCAIYPLLACRLDPHWRFTATEADDYSWEHAKANIASNGLQDRICVEKAALEGPILFPLLQNPHESFDFTMCNPPFYGSKDEVMQSAEMKEFLPNAVCAGADVEMITAGGEAGFVARMVEESTQIRTRCKWYTSMLGKLSSISDIVGVFRTHEIVNYAITEFVQGRTRRWAVGWSFMDAHLPDTIARTHHPDLHALMPTRNTLSQAIHIASSTSRTEMASLLRHILASLEGVVVRESTDKQGDNASSEMDSCTVFVEATHNSWSRNARRRRHRTGPSLPTPASPPVRMTAVCSVRKLAEAAIEKNAMVEFRWVYGADRALFESFASHCGRKLEAGFVPRQSRGG